MRTLLLALGIVVLRCASAHAQGHNDVMLYINDGAGTGTSISGGKLTTGGSNDEIPVNHPSAPGYDPLEPLNPVLLQRVFGYDFGEDPNPALRFVIGDPGFKNDPSATIGIAPNNGVLPAGSTLSITPLTNLLFWDGTGAVNFTAAPLGVQLGFQRGTTGLLSGLGIDAPFPTIGTTSGAGRIHVHAETTLRFAGSTDPFDLAGNAPDGIYYFGATLALSTGGSAASDPLYFVFNNGLTETLHDDAMAFVQATAVPEPGTWALLGTAFVGSVFAGRKFRRRAVTES